MRKALKTSRAWMLKELAMEMWEQPDRQAARQIFDAWYAWAIRSRLAQRVARMIKRHLEGVLNAIVAAVTNARLEGINTMIQGLKRSARGFRNRAPLSVLLALPRRPASQSEDGEIGVICRRSRCR